MKNSIQAKKRNGNGPTPVKPAPRAAPSSKKHWALLALCLVFACAGTWAIMEHLVWNRLPSSLVGKWVVQGGEQDGATFDFYPNGVMIGRVNLGGKEGIVNAQVAVEEDTLFITTKNPRTGQADTKTQTIKTLNAKELVLDDERKNVFRMVRAIP
jgi:uncharacterized protein (TIGR03066 family)